MTLSKKISLIILVAGYCIAGVNHFWHPDGYIHIIPPYIPYPKLMNILAGAFEVLFGLILIWPKSRPFAAWGIILMLAAFMPVHIKMVIDAPFMLGKLYVTPLIAWVRVLLQAVLMVWVGWYITRQKNI